MCAHKGRHSWLCLECKHSQLPLLHLGYHSKVFYMLKKCGRCVVPIQIDIGINNCVGCVLQNLRCAHLDIVCNTWDNGLALEVRKCAYARTFASSASSGKVTTQPSHIMPDWGQLDVHPPVAHINIMFVSKWCVYGRRCKQCAMYIQSGSIVRGARGRRFSRWKQINLAHGIKIRASSEEEDFGNEPPNSNSNSSGATFTKSNNKLAINV